MTRAPPLRGVAAAGPYRPLRANGSVIGTVKLAGHPPALPPLTVVKDGSVCGATKSNQAVIVGPGGALRNVVVSLRAPKSAVAATTDGGRPDRSGRLRI